MRAGRWNCGSGAHGTRQPWEIDSPEATGVPGVADGESELLRQAAARAILESSRSRGTVPEHWRRWAEETIRPAKIDWRRELAALIRAAVTTVSGVVDYSYSRPARRGSPGGVVMPALRRPVPSVAVVLDTSGSMGDADIAMCLSEIDGILKALGAVGCPVIACDAAAAPAQRVVSAKRVVPYGGGGTDMRVGVAAAVALKPKPNVVIVLSDGATPWPATAPPCAVVVGLIGHCHAGKESVPNWVRALVIDPDDGEVAA